MLGRLLSLQSLDCHAREFQAACLDSPVTNRAPNVVAEVCWAAIAYTLLPAAYIFPDLASCLRVT